MEETNVKHREIVFDSNHPDPHQGKTAALRLSDVPGVLDVQVISDTAIKVSYHLLDIDLQQIEDGLVDAGFHLSGKLIYKLRRALYYYTEETERANLNQMNFYVPMQNANGRVLVEGDTATIYRIDYMADDATWVEWEEGSPRYYAKPLVSVYIDEPAEEVHLGSGGAGLGAQFYSYAHRRRRQSRKTWRKGSDPLSPRAQRLSPYRSRQIDLSQLRSGGRILRQLQPAPGRHQPLQGRGGVCPGDHGRCAVAGV